MAARSLLVDQDVISNPDCSAAGHVGIEPKPATESADDILEHLRIALEGVWINRRHRAAATQSVEPHQRVCDAQVSA